jgi:ribose/xylose/arabinose/galactoside ABC-type transport system permease subunit
MKRQGFEQVVSSLVDNLIWIFVIVTIVAFSLLTDRFLTPVTISNILVRIASIGMLVLSQSYTFITGNFDLSVESTLGFTAMLAALLLADTAAGGLGLLAPPLVAIVAMLVVGALIGLFNGFLITRLGINNLLVTIAMLFILRGVTYGMSPAGTISFFPDAFTWLGEGALARLPMGRANLVIPVGGAFVILAFILGHIHTRYTQFGRNMYAVGADAEAAKTAGIPVGNVILIVYIIAGVCAAFAGLISVGRLDSATPTMGTGIIFSVHAAAIIGGMSIYGGRGSIPGAFGGVLLWSILDTGLNLMQVSPFWIEVSRGALLLIAVFIDALRVRYQRRVQTRLALAGTTIGLEDTELNYA